jgi:hypothetical protein
MCSQHIAFMHARLSKHRHSRPAIHVLSPHGKFLYYVGLHAQQSHSACFPPLSSSMRILQLSGKTAMIDLCVRRCTTKTLPGRSATNSVRCSCMGLPKQEQYPFIACSVVFKCICDTIDTRCSDHRPSCERHAPRVPKQVPNGT